MDSCGSGLAWLLGTLGHAACLPFPPPSQQVFIEHLLCVSQGSKVRGQLSFS